MNDIEDICLPLGRSEVISVSRRTDIPAFYMDYFLVCMKKGSIVVNNPGKSTRCSKISLKPDDVKCFAWWSKDYYKWIQCYMENMEIFNKYGNYFNFTLNSTCRLEKIGHTVDERLDQMRFLIRTFGKESVVHRFDPIVFWKTRSGVRMNNLGEFEYIISETSKMGIKKVIFSFCIPYKKTMDRMKSKGMILEILDDEEQKKIVDDLYNITSKYDVELCACCDNNLLGDKVKPASCIDGDVIERLIRGPLINNMKDEGQRSQCNCIKSRDVGSYEQKCMHSCVYCYANAV